MEKREIKITFFGDSICTGQGVPIHKGWVLLVSERLSKENPNTTIGNTSVNGRTTRQALERMPYEVQASPPNILLVQFGMNDCNYWESDAGAPRVSRGAFKANLKEIVDRAFTIGVEKICLNTNHPSGRNTEIMKYTDITYQESNSSYNDAVREVYLEDNSNNLFLCDVEKHFKNITSGDNLQRYLLNAPDLIHLNEEGHIQYSRLFYPILEKMMSGLSGQNS